MQFSGFAFIGIRISDGEKTINAMLAHLREDLTNLAGIEVPYPHVRQTHICGCEHQVGENNGGICLSRIHTITLADPGLFVTAADD